MAYLLPATFVRTTGETTWRITGWGWEAALLSLLPIWVGLSELPELHMFLLGCVVAPSNLGFIAAAVLLRVGKRRAALVCAGVAIVSMIASSYFIDAHQSELVRLPAGHLGPGYYSWVIAGILMVWTAYSARR